MSYESEHDWSWLFRALPPRGQIAGEPEQTLPFRVMENVAGQFDALGWARYQETAFDTVNAANTNHINLTETGSGLLRLYTHAHVRASGGVPAADFWIALNDGTNAVAVSEAKALVDGEADGHLVRPVIVPAGFHLDARSSALSGVGVTIFLEAFFIELTLGEYILPS